MGNEFDYHSNQLFKIVKSENMKYYNTMSLLVITLLFFGCSGRPTQEEVVVSDDLIAITQEQYAAEKMTVGNLIIYPFTQIIRTNGVVSATPQSKAEVHSFVRGIIKSISVNMGDFVHKGELLCSIESKTFIQLQQSYLESLASLTAAEANYNRVKQLRSAKISSQKEFLQIESEYKTLHAKIKGLQAELNILNVDIKKLKEGNLAAYLPIYSTIEGSITKLNCSLGEYVDSQELLFKIVDNRDLQLHFSIYQDAVAKVKKGQLLSVFCPDNPEIRSQAKVVSIGKSIDNETGSINCLAKFNNQKKKNLIDGMYLQVEVILDSAMSQAILTEALIKTGSKYYLMVKDKQEDDQLFFRMEEILIGNSSKGYTQVLSDKELKDILIKGAYYFQSN